MTDKELYTKNLKKCYDVFQWLQVNTDNIKKLYDMIETTCYSEVEMLTTDVTILKSETTYKEGNTVLISKNGLAFSIDATTDTLLIVTYRYPVGVDASAFATKDEFEELLQEVPTQNGIMYDTNGNKHRVLMHDEGMIEPQELNNNNIVSMQTLTRGAGCYFSASGGYSYRATVYISNYVFQSDKTYILIFTNASGNNTSLIIEGNKKNVFEGGTISLASNSSNGITIDYTGTSSTSGQNLSSYRNITVIQIN